jgi:hypothetical protein
LHRGQTRRCGCNDHHRYQTRTSGAAAALRARDAKVALELFAKHRRDAFDLLAEA